MSTYTLFPSPCGVLVLKLTTTALSVVMPTFPSPCGVLVLKSCDDALLCAEFTISVPLRGSGS